MSLRICYLAVYVFAITVSGTIKAIGAEVAKDPHRLSDYFAEARETTLSSLVGRFIVVGSQPVTGKTYRGSVVVTREGKQPSSSGFNRWESQDRNRHRRV